MGLPDGHGLDTVRRAQTVAPNVPVIVLTGLDDEVMAEEAMKVGAQDYLIKGQIENRALPRALRHAIERHRMLKENELIQINQMHFKDEFLSHVSHELRSPLAAIYQFVTILLDSLAGDLTLEQREYLDIVLRNVKQLQSMIEDLLQVTRARAGKLLFQLQRTSVSDAIGYTLTSLQGTAAAKGITVSSGTACQLPMVFADPTRVQQILVNLCENAIKFTPAGGAVRIQAQVLAEDPGFLQVEVSDTGCGISPEMNQHIFEQLYQLEDSGNAGRKGLGLGLYICKELVTQQGGNIWVRSEPQKGSHFFFTLPIFSLATLIAPTLAKKKPGAVVGLFTIEIGCRDGWISPTIQKEMANSARTVLLESLRPDTIVLPNMGPASERELLFVVVYEQHDRAKGIGERIEEQFQRCEQLQAAGLTFAVSLSVLTPISKHENDSFEIFVKQVTGRIQDRINTIYLQRSLQT